MNMHKVLYNALSAKGTTPSPAHTHTHTAGKRR